MNDTDLTYPLVDRMQIRDEALVTGRFLRLIVGGEREPGLQKLDAIADLFGVSTASLLEVDSYEVSSEEFDDALKEIIKTYSQATPEGKQAIESTAKIAPRKTKPRVRHKPKRTQ